VPVFGGDGTGAWQEIARSPERADADASAAAVVDLQNDRDPDTARLDLAILHGSKRKQVWARSFDGSRFPDHFGCAAGVDPVAMAFAKLDGDGLQDVLIVHRGDDAVSIWLAEPEPLALSYGVGCAGTAGRVPVIAPRGTPPEPRLGNGNFQVGVHDARGFSAAVLLWSPTPSLPGACQLQIGAILHLQATLTTHAGNGAIKLPVPNAPNLLGVEIYQQWAVLDAGGLFLDALSLSDGLMLRLGR
jgi:hypothetical protein